MEQPSYNNAILNNACDPFLNGGQQAGSGSSSSATSTNGTPSHSFKGSHSPSSPSSDELSVGCDLQSRHHDQVPYTASVPLAKQVTSNNFMMNSHHQVVHSKSAINAVQPPYVNHAQGTGDVLRPSTFNQNLFQGNSDHSSHAFENISDYNKNTSGAPTNITENMSRAVPHEIISQSQSAFPASSNPPSSTPKLPNSSHLMTSPNTASYFNNLDSSNIINFSTSRSVPPNITNHVAPNFPTPLTNSHSKPTIESTPQAHSNYITNNAEVSPFGPPHSQNSSSEPMSHPTKPQISNSFPPISSSAEYSRFQEPKSGSGTLQPPDQHLLRANPPTQQHPPPRKSQPFSEQLQPPFVSMPLHSSTYPSSAMTTPPMPPPVNQIPTSYQNVSLYQNASQPFPNAVAQFPTRSQYQSPLDGNQGSNALRNTHVSGMSANQNMTGPHSNLGGGQCQPPTSQSFQQSAPSQQRTSNRMYEVNGYQNAPVYGQHGQQGQSYQPVSSTMNSRYPAQQSSDMQQMDTMSRQFGGMNVTKQGYYGARGIDTCDLLRIREVLPKQKIEAPSILLPSDSADSNCHPDVFRSTLTKVPETKALLDKSRLPLGILLHPFRDLTHLSVIQCSTIVRCRACRTYINPFVYFMDNRHWKCNLCFRANDLPDDFRYNPLTKMHDDPLRRPEVKNATIEFIASSEYMVRPPQPAIYLFILDVSRIGTQTGYLSTACKVLSDNLAKLPGDSRTAVGFITVDSAVRFYDLGENLNQPHELIVTDVDDIFIPHPENLLINLQEQMELIKTLLEQIPEKFKESFDTNCALGAALQAAYKLMAPTGGRVTVFVSGLPNYGPGALKPREDPNQRGTNKINLNPATDFYKKLALDCNSQHIAIDLFVVNAQFVDLATISGISQISGGCMHHFPLYSCQNDEDVEKLVKTLERYLTRKIGFEAVMRMRCTKGLSIHSFHGNFFVRTTDLLALPNINPDAGFGMQVSIDESLSDLQSVCFQAALLYTSSKGERRIRVHTLCLPVTNNLHDVLVSADQQCIVGLLAKMAVDRSLQASVADAREAFVNVVCDIFNSYKMVSSSGQTGTLLAPNNLMVFPLYILGLLKTVAFRLGTNTRTDDRVFAMYQMKCIPLDKLLEIIYPDLYAIHNLSELPQEEVDGKILAIPAIMQLSAEHIDSTGVYLLDEGDTLVIFVCHNVPPHICQKLFGCPQFNAIPDDLDDLPSVDTQESKLAHAFIDYLQAKKPYPVIVQILKDTTQLRTKFYEKLVDDKTEFGISYHEFLQTVSSQMNN